jgi:outer membrane biosynthesis protein TonB
LKPATWAAIMVLLGVLLMVGLWIARPATPETDLPYDMEDRLQRLEEKLDLLDARDLPPPLPPKPAPKRPPRPRRLPTPKPTPTPPEPRDAPMEEPTTLWVEAPPRTSRPVWTWEAVDAARAFRRYAEE